MAGALSNSRFQLPAWWFVLDVTGALLLACGLLAWLAPETLPVAGVTSRMATAMIVFGALLLAAATFILLRMLIDRSRSLKH